MRRLLEDLGFPRNNQSWLWPAVHVAGTKGKGSTVSMISSILESSGYRVGCYTRYAKKAITFPSLVFLHMKLPFLLFLV